MVDPTLSPSSDLIPENQPEPVVSQDDSSPPRGNAFPIVGIGASAGGLEAFSDFLRAVPADTGMAFVLVQHLDPQHESLLGEILTPLTRMPVITVRDGIRVEPNNVYVIPPNSSIVLTDSHLQVARREAGLHLPIDIFFRSLAEVQGSRAIGVVLSGNASDGSLGLRAIKAECGLTFAQDEATARFGGMPRNAISTGAVDYILSPAEIGRELGQLGRHPYLLPAQTGDSGSETLPQGDGDLKRIFTLLSSATSIDFSHYKPTTIRRRIGRRMMILGIGALRDYVIYTEHHPAELRHLYRDLLISVTSFFRDSDAFESLTRYLSSMLIGDKRRRDAVRVWVPGCATGEEVYSLAICLNELLQELELSLPIQLFGTDASDLALERARQGVYSEVITENVSPERLRRFFSKVDGGYQIAKLIRESCVFARHDVTRDPPFSRVDLVSCRNLLIYLDTVAQRRVLPVFHYALKPAGLLLLGTAETTGAASDLFTPVDKQHSIYAKKPGPVHLPPDLGIGESEPEVRGLPSRVAAPPGMDLQRRLDRLLESKYSPDAVLVSADLQILQFRGHTSPYLDPAPGDANLNLLRMRESLVVPLRRVLQNAAQLQHSVKERGVMLERDGHRQEIALEVTPIAGEAPGERHWFIVFAPPDRAGIEEKQIAPPANEPGGAQSHLAHLERELAETREYLRNLTEDYEAHAEELRAANEEARSANEELQSTNEELGTTKEELQSANEELTTINEELQNRNIELSAINDDVKNLLAAVSVAILMVDSDSRVRRFNTVAEKLLELAPIDIGRPVGHIRGRIRTPDLEQKVRAVIETLHTTEQEVQDNDGHWYSVITRPYRTVDDRIAGAVITIQDINPLKRGLAAAEEARDYAEGMIETVREPLVVLDADLRIQRATSAFYETFLVSRQETEGRLLYDLGNSQWNRPRLRELIGSALFRNESFQDYEVRHQFPHIGLRTMRLNGRRIPRKEGNKNPTLLLAIEDVTERREMAEIRFQRLFETAKDGIVVVDVETEMIIDVNPYLLQCTGLARENMVGKRLIDTEPFLNLPQAASLISSLKANDSVRIDDIPLRRADGGTLDMELMANLYRVGSQPVAQLNLRDITLRKEQEESLRRSVEEKAVLVREIHHRVKNNLQVIVSLLSLQSNYTDDPKALAAFEEAEGRVRAIAHIHETLYATPDLAQIEFAAYLTKLVHELLSLHARTPGGIGLDLCVEEMVLDMEQAIPLGLIANELIVNSLKHGILGGSGKLSIALTYMRDPQQPEDQTLDEGWVLLRVADDGPGLAPGIDLANARSMGFKLLNLLTRQLGGKVEISSAPGAVVEVSFPLSFQKI